MVHSINMHDRKIQDMGAENVYIYVSYDSNHTKIVVFFLKISMVTNVILILYNSSINNKLISRDLLPVFAPFLRQKMIANSHNSFKSQ